MPLNVFAQQLESPRTEQDYFAWEIFGNRALRQGDWKLRWQYKPFGKEEWELFNLAADPGERHNLAAQQEEKLRQLLVLWNDYVATNNVILPSRSVYEGLEEKMPERFPVEPGYPPLIYKKRFEPPEHLTGKPK